MNVSNFLEQVWFRKFNSMCVPIYQWRWFRINIIYSTIFLFSVLGLCIQMYSYVFHIFYWQKVGHNTIVPYLCCNWNCSFAKFKNNCICLEISIFLDSGLFGLNWIIIYIYSHICHYLLLWIVTGRH